jgi:hypothetical protein
VPCTAPATAIAAVTNGAELPEPQRRPDQEREQQVGVVPHPGNEDGRADAHERGQEQAAFQHLPAPDAQRQNHGPDEQQRRNQEVAHRIPRPPQRPLGAVRRTRDAAVDPERRHAHGRGDRRADHRREQHEREHVARAIERPAEGHAAQEVRPGDGLERVSDRNRGRDKDGDVARGVGDERAERDRRPEARPEDEQRGERDAARRPDGRDDAVRDG